METGSAAFRPWMEESLFSRGPRRVLDTDEVAEVDLQVSAEEEEG